MADIEDQSHKSARSRKINNFFEKKKANFWYKQTKSNGAQRFERVNTFSTKSLISDLGSLRHSIKHVELQD